MVRGWLLGLLGVIVIGAGVEVYRENSPVTPEQALRGDHEHAPVALSLILKKTPAEQRLPLLLKYVDDENPNLRYAAVDALGTISSPQAADALERAFRDSASMARQRAMEVLPQVDVERGFRLLLIALKDDDTWVRESAVNQLNILLRNPSAQDGRAVPTLLKALNDSSSAVSVTACTILRRVTKQPYRLTGRMTPDQKRDIIGQWDRWWDKARANWPAASGFEEVRPLAPTRSDPAAEFNLKDVDNNSLRLSDQKGKITLLNFWGTWCPPCQYEVPDLVKLDIEYRGRNVDIVGIAVSESGGAAGLKAWCRDHGIRYRQALAVPSLQEAYGDIHEVPVTILIDAEGHIRRRWDGYRDYETFRAALENTLQNR